VNIEDMKAVWREYDRRLDGMAGAVTRIRRESRLEKSREALRRHRTLPILELVGGAATALILGSFLADHWGEWRYFVPGLVLHAAALCMIGVSVLELVVLGRVDFSRPVVAIQREISRARTIRIKSTLAMLLFACLLWTPMAIVAAKGLLGVDLYAAFGLAWIAANFLFGVGVIPLAIVLSRRSGERIRRASFARRLADDIAGRSLSRASAFLADIEEFEREAA